MNGGVARGCGDSRDCGGIYMECGSVEGGRPMWDLIKDPLEAVDPDALGLSPLGVKLIEMDGVTHVFDWVGRRHYPNAADFLEEAVRYGLSRRISRKEDLQRLGPQSKLVLVHPNGYPVDVPFGDRVPCPSGKHPEPSVRALIAEAGALWRVGEPSGIDTSDVVTPTTPIWARYGIEAPPGEFGIRHMPAFRYTLGLCPHGVVFRPGIVMVAPIERLCVVRDPHDVDIEREALDAAQQSSIPVTLEDE